MTLQPEIRKFASAAEVADGAAHDFLALAGECIAQRGRFTVALSGGRTPRAVYTRIGELTRATPPENRVSWDHVHLFFGDERMVAPDDPDSNFRMANEALLSRIAIPPQNVHRVLTERGAAGAAEDYEKGLRHFFRVGAGQFPRFDLVLLGLGPDGHTASLFPGTPGAIESHLLVVANPVEKLQSTRISITFPVINRAANVWFLVVGGDKAAIAKAILHPGSEPQPADAPAEFPAQQVRPSEGKLAWYLDGEAAAQL